MNIREAAVLYADMILAGSTAVMRVAQGELDEHRIQALGEILEEIVRHAEKLRAICAVAK